LVPRLGGSQQIVAHGKRSAYPPSSTTSTAERSDSRNYSSLLPHRGHSGWPADAPLFVCGDGQRITRGTLQYRALRAFRQAGIDGTRAKGALLHGLRHTFATELANADISVYALMNLLGHEAMTTSQRYITAAGTDTRDAAAKSGLYEIVRSTE
jgi:site-specific recombinase XerD